MGGGSSADYSRTTPINEAPPYEIGMGYNLGACPILGLGGTANNTSHFRAMGPFRPAAVIGDRRLSGTQNVASGDA